MNDRLLVTKCIALLYRESISENIMENSSELVRSVLENIKTSEINIGISGEKDIIDSLKNIALEMCNNPSDHEYVIEDLLMSIKIATCPDDKLYSNLHEMLAGDINEKSIRRSIVNNRKALTDYFKTLKLAEILSKASYQFKYKREQIKDTKQFIAEVIAQLEPLQVSTKAKDPAIIGDIDLGDDESLNKLFDDIKKANEGQSVYKTGWKALNRMLQGGFRPGLTVIGALQHKYKTGFTLSLFKQIALNNKPLTTDPNKKPLLLRISFEDDLELNLQFLYQSLKYDETREKVDMNVTNEYMSTYVKDKLQVNGFHIKLLRVNPDMWTYRSICNKIVELEAQGYTVEVLMMDYLSKVSLEGCAQGPAGTEYLDLMSKIRNYATSKRIVAITPHQLSTEAKQLIRNGMPEDQLVKQVAGLGYYQHTKQLDQIVDLEIYIHLFKHNKETYLSVGRGKHRIPTIANDGDMYYLMKFPKYGMPIPDDAEDEDQSIPKLSAVNANGPDELFEF